jgi:hypothetical protein
MMAAPRGGTFAVRTLGLSLALSAALGASACVGPDMNEIGD